MRSLKTPFFCSRTCGFQLLTVDLTNLPTSVDLSLEAEAMAERVAEIHNGVTDHLEKMTAMYKLDADKHRRFKEFKEGN